MIHTYYSSTVRVTENDLCAHVDQFVHEKEPAFEHLLVDKYTSLCLGGGDQDDT